MAEFYNTQTPIDLLFLGSSHAARSFDPSFYETAFNIQSFNLGSSGQNPITSFFLLKEVLRLGHKPKILVIEAYWRTLEGRDYDFSSSAEVFYELPLSANKFYFFWDGFQFPESLKLLSKTFQYREVLKNWRIHAGIQDSSGLDYKGKGFVTSEEIASITDIKQNPFKQKPIRLNPLRERFLRRTIELAQEHGIQVLLVVTPIPPTAFKDVVNYSDFAQFLMNLQRDFNVELIDYNSLNLINHKFVDEDFSDDNHLNQQGVQILSRDLAARLNFAMSNR